MFKKPKYKITLATKSDIDFIYSLCQDRVRWMRKNDIQQWYVLEKSNLKKILSREVERKDLYKVLRNGELVGSFVLSTTDHKHWELSNDTYYLWRLVTSLEIRGVGARIIKFCDQKCKKDNKEFLRGYYVASNEVLKKIYENYGFAVVGTYQTPTRILNLIEKHYIVID